jgi:hemolysin activation/secretion protein
MHDPKCACGGKYRVLMGFLAYCALLSPVATSAAPDGLLPSTASTFAIKGFEITGDNPLPAAEVARLLAPYQRVDATLATLHQAVSALEAALKRQGYGQYRVVVLPQELGQTVSLQVVPFVIGQVTVEGRLHWSEDNIRSSIPALTPGATPNFRTLATQTAMANESHGKQVQVVLREARQPDTVDARIVVNEYKPWRLSLTENNTGSTATGSDRFTAFFSHSNVLDRDHQFSAAYSTSLERSQDVRQLGLQYRIPLYAVGGMLGMTYTQSDVTGNFGDFTSTAAGKAWGVSYRHFLPPESGYLSSVKLGVDEKQFDVTQLNGQPYPGQVVRRSRPIAIGYTARKDSSTSGWGYTLEWTSNIAGGGGNDLLSYQSEDPRIRNVNWNALHGSAQYETGYSNGWLLGVRGRLQYSPDALLSGEQFGIGGNTSVRGTPERALSGDSGAQASVELTTREFAPGLRLLGFMDAAWVVNYDVDNTPYRASQDRLASVGLGIRYVLAGWNVSADYGVVVAGSTLAFAPAATVPKSGDSKLHVQVAAHF